MTMRGHEDTLAPGEQHVRDMAIARGLVLPRYPGGGFLILRESDAEHVFGPAALTECERWLTKGGKCDG
jgi:hypothetical protein